MRKTADIHTTIVDDLLCGDSTIYFEHGYPYPKLGTRAIIGVSTKQVIFKVGTKIPRIKGMSFAIFLP